MTQAENKVNIAGILSEINIKESTSNEGKEYISGDIKVRVTQEVNGKQEDMEVPISVYAAKLTRKGTLNPAYTSIQDVKDNFVSIASVADINKADCVSISGANIMERAFYPEGKDAYVSYPQIRASFIRKISRNELVPDASFVAVIVVGNKSDEVDKEGEVTGRLLVNGLLVQYGDRVESVKFVVQNENAINHIRQYWDDGSTVKIKGKVNFSSKTEWVEEEMGFGDPIRTPKVTNTHEFIIGSGSAAGFDGDMAYDIAEIQKGLTDRKARIEETKNYTKKASASSTNQKVTPETLKEQFGF